jgi:hypothetical protein
MWHILCLLLVYCVVGMSGISSAHVAGCISNMCNMHCDATEIAMGKQIALLISGSWGHNIQINTWI